jgi:hypothetical protein
VRKKWFGAVRNSREEAYYRVTGACKSFNRVCMEADSVRDPRKIALRNISAEICA